jgi:photosystem II stability/assembly factor-like uncharacterized protein
MKRTSIRTTIVAGLLALLVLAAGCGRGESADPSHPTPPTQQPPPAAEGRGPVALLGVDVVDAQTAFAFGDLDAGGSGGVVLRTLDGGATWVAVLRVPDGTLVGLDFADPQNGVVLADSGGVFETSDGGQTWNGSAGAKLFKRTVVAGRDPAKDGPSLYTSATLDGRVGWAGGIDQDDQPTGLDRPLVLRTVDGGATWQRTTIEGAEPAPVVDFAVEGGRIVYATLGTPDYYAVGGLLRSTDGGVSWTAVPTGIKKVLASVAVPAPSRIVVVGVAPGYQDLSEIHRSDDGGATWSPVFEAKAALAAVRFADALNGWAVGSKIFRTSDGGTTWVEQTAIDVSGGQVLDAPSSDESIDDFEPYFTSVVLLAPGRGFAAADEGMYTFRR